MWNIKKKNIHKAMCISSTEKNKNRYESMKNKVKKAVSKGTIEKAEDGCNQLKICPNVIVRRVRALQVDSKEVEGGRCMRGSDGKMCFINRERG